MKKKLVKSLLNRRGQIVTEYALVMVIMAAIASLLWIFYQGVTDQTFYGSFSETKTMGLEWTIANPFP